MFPIIVGKNSGIYSPEGSMPVVAYTVYAGVVYEGRGLDSTEAIDDLGYRLQLEGIVEDGERWDWRLI